MNETQLDKVLRTVKSYTDAVARPVIYVGSDAESGYDGWYKVAEQTCSGHGNTNITFMVTKTYSVYDFGILQLQIRSDSSSISCKSFGWLTRKGFSLDNFIIVISGMKWTMYAYNGTRYVRLAFEILSQSSIKSKDQTWTLTFANNSTKESTTPTATVKSSDLGMVNTANKLATARTISLTGDVIGSISFDGSKNISIPTTVADFNHEHTHLEIKGTNTIKTVAEDTTTNWGAQKTSLHWYTNTGQLIDQPTQWGYLMNFGKSGEVHQIWMSQSSGDIKHRGGNTDGWTGTWRTLLDSSNFTTYAAPASHTHNTYLPLSGGTMTGPVTVSGESKFHSGTYTDPLTGTICAIKASGNVAVGGTIYEGGTSLSDKYAPKSHTHNLYKESYRQFFVDGNAATYYPVIFSVDKHGDGYPYIHFNISRCYVSTAPDSWNTSTHKGGLTFSIRWSGDISWGGNDHTLIVDQFVESYCSMVAGMKLCTYGLVVWLRGGGALYHINSEYGAGVTASVELNGFTDEAGTVFSARINTNNVDNEIRKVFSNRSSSGIFDNNVRVYSPVNKPTPADIGALSLSGGTLTGGLEMGANNITFTNSDTGDIVFNEGTTQVARIWQSSSGLLLSAGSGVDPNAVGVVHISRNANSITIGGNKIYHAGSKPTLSELGAAASSHNHTSLTGVTSITFATPSDDSAVISTTIDGVNSYMDFTMSDDATTDMWRWRFSAWDAASSSQAATFNAMTLVAASTTKSKLTVNGNVNADKLCFTGYGVGGHTNALIHSTYLEGITGNGQLLTSCDTGRIYLGNPNTSLIIESNKLPDLNIGGSHYTIWNSGNFNPDSKFNDGNVHWAEGSSPYYLYGWTTDMGTKQMKVFPMHTISVNYANHAGWSDSAVWADGAQSATRADAAGWADNCQNAAYATNAQSAGFTNEWCSHSYGQSQLVTGNGDGSSWGVANVMFKSHWGLNFLCNTGDCNICMDTRAGSIWLRGSVYANQAYSLRNTASMETMEVLVSEKEPMMFALQNNETICTDYSLETVNTLLDKIVVKRQKAKTVQNTPSVMSVNSTETDESQFIDELELTPKLGFTTDMIEDDELFSLLGGKDRNGDTYISNDALISLLITNVQQLKKQMVSMQDEIDSLKSQLVDNQ